MVANGVTGGRGWPRWRRGGARSGRGFGIEQLQLEVEWKWNVLGFEDIVKFLLDLVKKLERNKNKTKVNRNVLCLLK